MIDRVLNNWLAGEKVGGEYPAWTETIAVPPTVSGQRLGSRGFLDVVNGWQALAPHVD